MATDLFPPSDFDEWAASYDESVQSDAFPFTGYRQLLQTIFNMAGIPSGAAVLDLGTGTGSLAALFVNAGCRVWGTDFSEEMLVRARTKLPTANFACADLRQPLPANFPQRFDAIVSAYAFHHFPLEEKVSLAGRFLVEHSLPGGSLLIGDIAFPDSAAQDVLIHALGDEWEQEYYWLADETAAAFAAVGLLAEFTPISHCAGIFRIRLA
jgi:putative AdoMet-dependent methyltransferase